MSRPATDVAAKRWPWLVLIFVLLTGNVPAFGNASESEIVFAHGSRAYVVSTLTSDIERRWTDQLVGYLSDVLRTPAQVVATLADVPAGKSAIVLERGFDGVSGFLDRPVRIRTDEEYALLSTRRQGRPVLVAAAAQGNGIRRAIQRLIITSEQRTKVLSFGPVATFSSPWIEAREFEPSAWQSNYVRAKFWNPAVDPRVNYHAYSDEQLTRYIGMFDWFGFNGIRIEDGSWQWAVFGSQDASRDFVRRVARAARSQDMNRTLHVLYADVDGYGWSDPLVKYQPDPGMTAYQDPAVRATFERAYDYYAELAPDFNRIGGHLVDPGHLKSSEDMVAYVKLFREKVRKRNPDITLDVVMWAITGMELPDAFIHAGVTDLNVLLSNHHNRWDNEEKRTLHEAAKHSGIKLGYWSWYLADMEQDHLPSMYVNPAVISANYRMVRDAIDEIYAPTYWSEMEAYHLLNLFSMYVSGQLLWDPDRDPHTALMEVATSIWGPRNGARLYEILKLIEDVRTGPTWDTYFRMPLTFPMDNLRFGTDDAQLDLARAERAVVTLKTLSPDAGYVQKIPLPVSPQDITQLMVPHLRQIAAFSRFRLQLLDVEKRAAEGASKGELLKLLQAAWQPVPEYNTWIGMAGPVELNAQVRMLHKVEQRLGIITPDVQWLIEQDADRIAQTLRGWQGYFAEPVRWRAESRAKVSSWGGGALIDTDFFRLARYGRPGWEARFKLLLDRKVIVRSDPSGGEVLYQLTDWQRWARPAQSREPFAITKDRR